MLTDASSAKNTELLTVGVQGFGYLIVTDKDLNIIAASENFKEFLNESVTSIFEKPFSYIVSNFLPNYTIDIEEAVRQILINEHDRNLLEIVLDNKGCYLSIYQLHGHVYFEFEKKVVDGVVFFPKFEAFARILDVESRGVWEVLCDYISKILAYDRVTVYQFAEENNGQIIAETRRNDNLESIYGMYHSDFAVLSHARKIHLMNLCRVTQDINEDPVPIISLNNQPIDLLATNIRTLDAVHRAHLKKVEIGCNLSYSILINDKIWGLIFCQNIKPTRINLLKREAMVYMIQWTSARFADELEAKERDFNERIRQFELTLKEKLMLKSDILSVLSSFSKMICDFANADAMVIVDGDRIYADNMNIGRQKLKKLQTFILANSDQFVYTEPQFTFKYGHELGIEMDRFAGIAKIDIDSSRKFTLLFFRKEHVVRRTYMDKPVKYLEDVKANETFETEPHRHFDLWHHTIHSSSLVWTEAELFFFGRLRRLIKESINQKSIEISNLNEEVHNLNKALDAYAYTVSHDVKNPLSAINLSVQMMLQKPDMPKEVKDRMLLNMKQAVDLISDLLVAIHDFSKIKSFSYQTELLDIKPSILQVIDFCLLRYDFSPSHIEVGDLWPIYGHKTLVYQLFQNLIGNAIKYSARNENPKVEVYSLKEQEFVRYIIRDNGIGIAQEDLKVMFDSFKRLDNAYDFEGTGLGLTIVKNIVDKLDLQIKVDSQLGIGTEIQLLFPIEQ